MKIRLKNNNIIENYGKELLSVRGVEDIELFLEPVKEKALLNPKLLDNIDLGTDLLFETLDSNGKILLVVDSDTDGFTSAAIMYLYIKKNYPNAHIDYRLHEGKQHGLEDIKNISDEYSLVLLPDASTNDYIYHQELKQKGIKVLVIDHHEYSGEGISDNAIIINNQMSKQYPNKALTGAGLAYQFCRAYDNDYARVKCADDFLDLAALGVIGDMGSMISLENRYISYAGLSQINNFFFKVLVEKQDYSMKGKVNPMTISFYIVPLINAMIRVGSMEEKTRMFEAFLDGHKMVSSNKRGAKGTMEMIAVESARECTNARSKQNRIKEKAAEQLEHKIHKYDLLENKILLVTLDEDNDYPSELNGLIAMELSKKYNKPTIMARLNNEGYVRGSARGLNESELSDFKEFMNKSKLFEYAEG